MLRASTPRGSPGEQQPASSGAAREDGAAEPAQRAAGDAGPLEEAAVPLLEGRQDEEQGGAKGPEHGGGDVTWPQMTFILLADMFGLGTLTLPADFARLGWLLALAVMGVCFLGVLYSGRLFTLLSQQVPGARVFDDFGKASLGRTGQRLVYVAVYTTILVNPIIFQLTAVESLQQMPFLRGLSRWALGAIVAAVMLPLGQMQGLEDVALLSVLGTAGMLLSVGVAVAKLCLLPPASAPTELIHRPRDLSTPFVALLDIVFTYGGQVNWVRYLSQMRIRRHFPRSVATTAVLMTAAYVVMGGVGYWRLGPDFDQTRPITSILPSDALWTPFMNAGLLLHCIFAYQINLNTWAALLLALGWPEARAQNPGKLLWGAVSCAGIAIAFVVAATFPFFSTVAAVIASLGDLAGAYALPAVFLLTLAGSSLAASERWLLRGIVPVALALSGVGLFCSVRTLVQQFLASD